MTSRRAGVIIAALASGCSARQSPPASVPPIDASVAPIAFVSSEPDAAASSAPPPGLVECASRAADRVCLAAGIAQFGRAAPEARFEERPARAARLRAFEIDRDEVTAAAYANCVASGHCRAAQCDDGESPATEGPARCVAWSDARAYCSAIGGRLPTEAEWERAAAGLLPGHRTYPWGDARFEGDAGVADETPNGVLRMGGGVAEWVDDAGGFYVLPAHHDAGVDGAAHAATDTTEREFADAGIEALPFDAGLPIVDAPRGPDSSPWRIVRGGDDTLPAAEWTSTRRRFRLPGDRRHWIGFRCVFDLPAHP